MSLMPVQSAAATVPYPKVRIYVTMEQYGWSLCHLNGKRVSDVRAAIVVSQLPIKKCHKDRYVNGCSRAGWVCWGVAICGHACGLQLAPVVALPDVAGDGRFEPADTCGSRQENGSVQKTPEAAVLPAPHRQPDGGTAAGRRWRKKNSEAAEVEPGLWPCRSSRMAREGHTAGEREDGRGLG